MALRIPWFRRRFSYYEETSPSIFSDDNEPYIQLRGYRQKDPEYEVEVDPRMSQSMISEPIRRSQSPLDVSLALSEDSNITLTEMFDREQTPTFSGSMLKATPVMRRRRSNQGMRRNYRIMDPAETRMVFQQQQQLQQSQLEKEKEKLGLLRRKSWKKQSTLPPQPPMIITPPVLVNKTSECAVCRRKKSTQEPSTTTTTSDENMIHMHFTSPARVEDRRNTEDDHAKDTARLSFVSSSTGYSSARSSLRSSDGGEDQSEHSNTGSRDSRISTASCSLSTLSSARRSVLLNRGNLTQLDRIAIELLDTERAYVEDLNTVIKGYMDFLVEHRVALNVTLDAISSLFGCIERIFADNKKLYQKLDEADLDCVEMSKCFVDNENKFDDYIAYCTNYHRMMSTLFGLQQQGIVSRALQDRQAALGHSLPLSAYLLKPVQRILKYHLFLENIQKNLPSTISPEGVIAVKKAHEVMTTLASKINEEKKKAEHTERVEQLQTALQKWKADEIQTSNLSVYGDLLLEATFRQAGSKTTRLVFLFEEMLLIVKQRGSSYVCKDYIMCSNLMLNEWIFPEEPLAFQVLSFDNPRDQYVFLANSMEQKRTWMTELKRMMLDHYAVEIPEKTKQLMLSMDHTKMVQFGRPEFAEVSLKNHKKVPKYLEKRRKSVDTKEETARRRSLSASRLLGTSKLSINSNSTATTEDPQKCTCHMNAGTSQVHPESPSDTVLSFRSRYQQARNKRLPPRHDMRSSSGRRMKEEEIDKKFDMLYEELVGFDESPSEALINEKQLRAYTSEPMPQTSTRLRSKSLTRLDEFECEPLALKPTVERKFSKIDQLRRKSRKFGNGEETTTTADVLRPMMGRMTLSNRETLIDNIQEQQARQRAPLTATQTAQLAQALSYKEDLTRNTHAASVLNFLRQ